MGEIFTKAFGALWQVLAVGIVLGAGLPALFALGIKVLSSGRTLAADGATYTTPPTTRRPRGLHRALRPLRRRGAVRHRRDRASARRSSGSRPA